MKLILKILSVFLAAVGVVVGIYHLVQTILLLF